MNSNQQPSEALTALGRLVGTWRVTGGVTGIVTYEWMAGGMFLLQRVELVQQEHRINGLEVIGHERPFGEPPSADIKSRFYSSDGDTLDYVYELDGDELTIWGGEKGSPAYFRGRFSADGASNAGAWVYPGGGGYDSVMTRVEGKSR